MLFINLAGATLIALIVWWFWLYKPKETELNDKGLVIILENGIYSPARIKVAAGNAIDVTFMRKDPSPCAETLLIPGLDVSETLPLDKEKVIHLPALEPGEYAFHCQMQMYRGQIKAE